MDLRDPLLVQIFGPLCVNLNSLKQTVPIVQPKLLMVLEGKHSGLIFIFYFLVEKQIQSVVKRDRSPESNHCIEGGDSNV